MLTTKTKNLVKKKDDQSRQAQKRPLTSAQIAKKLRNEQRQKYAQ